MIEDPHADSGVVRRRHKRHARSQAGSQDTQPAVPQVRQPIHAGAYIHHRLPARMNGAAHVAGYVVIGARGLRRFALRMVSHSHAQRADAAAIEQPGQPHVSVRSGVPLRQHDHHPPLVVRRREPHSMRRIVLRVSRPCRTGEGQAISLQPVVVHWLVGEKAVGIVQSLGYETGNALGGIPVGVSRAGGEFQAVQPIRAPFERTHYPVGVARGELPLPPVHVSSVNSHHLLRIPVYQRQKKSPLPGS